MMRVKMSAQRKILRSWEEIAGYIGRGVRTAQRWEGELSLPVHRSSGRGRTKVFAFSDEMDVWLKKAPVLRIDATAFRDSERREGKPADLLFGNSEVKRLHQGIVQARLLLHINRELITRNVDICTQVMGKLRRIREERSHEDTSVNA